ncbi:uncharacterized protein LOC100193585 [Zea mays]|jgi:hypothetical protein|uniref:Uncharacterized protein n=1 Tax=Zea mays TaxID=4577 RepID=B4FFK0_MAIZE|nr:uncharacterized protein LOC100193585 [Zea mays]ACF80893.1 unknown [Zea mays]|eukprot:NP_001132164.1 uncharacterized protein LOC100193585 [Zea mays]
MALVDALPGRVCLGYRAHAELSLPRVFLPRAQLALAPAPSGWLRAHPSARSSGRRPAEILPHPHGALLLVPSSPMATGCSSPHLPSPHARAGFLLARLPSSPFPWPSSSLLSVRARLLLCPPMAAVPSLVAGVRPASSRRTHPSLASPWKRALLQLGPTVELFSGAKMQSVFLNFALAVGAVAMAFCPRFWPSPLPPIYGAIASSPAAVLLASSPVVDLA